MWGGTEEGEMVFPVGGASSSIFICQFVWNQCPERRVCVYELISRGLERKESWRQGNLRGKAFKCHRGMAKAGKLRTKY